MPEREPVGTGRYAALVVLGDSLSDNGNAGRFSDGPVWVERLAEALGLPLRPASQGGTNHAVGGARAAGGPYDLRSQAAALLAARRSRLDPAALHVVWGGANDLLATWQAADRDVAAREAARAIGATVDRLAAAGAQHLLVPNLPDIGKAPAVGLLGPAWAAEARRLSLVYDAALERELAGIDARHGLRIRRLDVFALADRVAAEPTAFGFTDVTLPCRGLLGGPGPPCATALFWDEIHPTAAAHARLAEAALRALGIRHRTPAGPL